MQHDNPNEVGNDRATGVTLRFTTVCDSDLILLFGTDFPYQAFMPEKNKIAQVDLAPERLGRRAQVDLGLCGDAKETIKALLPLYQGKRRFGVSG